MPKGAGTVVGKGLELLQSLGIEGRVGGQIAVRGLLQGIQPPGAEGPNGHPEGTRHRLGGAVQRLGNLGGTLAPGACQQALAATQGEGLGRAQARLQLLALGVREGTHEDGGFHIP